MKIVPRPEGFELRNKRSDRANDASKWLPEDALYDASVAMQKQPPVLAMTVAWFYKDENGKTRFTFRLSNEDDAHGAALAALMQQAFTKGLV